MTPLLRLVGRALVLAFPRPFRDRLGRPLIQTWLADCRTVTGRVAVGRLLAGAANVVRAGLAERIAQHRVYRPDLHERGSVTAAWWQDIRYGARRLHHSRGFTAVAVLTLVLGIGASTTIFSVVDTVLLRPLPFPDQQQLVFASARRASSDQTGISPADFNEYRADVHAMSHVAAIGSVDAISNLTGGAGPEQVRSQLVSWNFFETLGLHSSFGRSFVPADEQEIEPQVAILGHAIWMRDFGGDPQVIGRTLTLDGRSVTIVGVLPADISSLSRADVWQPLPMGNQWMNGRDAHFLAVIARLKAGGSIEQARAELGAMANGIAMQHPDTNTGWSLNLTPLTDHVVGDTRTVLVLWLGAVALLLLISCANVANLQLARATTCRKEMAIRTALGAGTWRIVCQSLTESLLLASIGGALGLLAAVWGVEGVRALAPAGLPRADELRVNPEALAFAAGLSLLTGLLFGLAPAIRLSRTNCQTVLRESGRGSDRVRHRLGSLLVIGEVALSMALLFTGGLLLHSLWRLVHVDPGFRPDHVLTATLHVSNGEGTRAQKQVLYRTLEERLDGLTGVEAAGMISELPLSGQDGIGTFRIDGGVDAANQLDTADLRQATPGLLPALGVQLSAGRWISRDDSEHAPGTVVVNEAFVRRFFDRQNPIGRRLRITSDLADTREIVGVIATVKHGSLNEEPRAAMYVPLAQYSPPDLAVVVRTSGTQRSAAAIQATLKSLERLEAISPVRPMSAVLAMSVARPRLSAMLLGVFAAAALLLAGVGIYGLVAYTASQRTCEIGIRIALGAGHHDVLGMVLAGGLRLSLAGTAVGLATALTFSRLLRGMLFGVSATDPVTVALVTLLLLGVSLAACWVPARRAMRVDPIVALRHE
jgi:putative ABC transport system permease protein